VLAAASLAGAAADLSGSTITTEPAAPIEREEAVYRLRLSNRGDADAVPTFLRLRLPRTGFFVDASGADDLAFEAADRLLTGSVELPAGATREVEIRLVVAEGSAGDSLAASLQMNAFAAGIEEWIHSTVPIDARPNTSGVVVGPVRVTEAGLAVLAFLVGYAVLLVAFRGRGARPLFALVAAAGFLAYFGVMAALDWRTLEEWPESACTILDRRTSRAEKGNDARLQIETLALRYAVEGETRVSTGLDTGMQRLPRFDVGEDDPFPVGATVPCWTDPEDPARVIVRRGFGAAYLFALFPLPVLAWGWILLRARLGAVP
jgi:hypothetical protein